MSLALQVENIINYSHISFSTAPNTHFQYIYFYINITAVQFLRYQRLMSEFLYRLLLVGGGFMCCCFREKYYNNA